MYPGPWYFILNWPKEYTAIGAQTYSRLNVTFNFLISSHIFAFDTKLTGSLRIRSYNKNGKEGIIY